jgi:hypothetical protein
MKKILMFVILGLQLHQAYAEPFSTPTIPDVNFNLCSVLSIRDFSSHFTSEDGKISAILHYNALKTGNAVTGEIIQNSQEANAQAVLIDSHCQNGIVQLSWLQPKFYGTVVGYIDLINQRISRVTGIINGERVSAYFTFTGYGS